MVSELEKHLEVSFVLPAYNEGAVIEDVLEKLEGSVNGDGLRYEVVVVDDGSIDDTRLKAWRYAAGKRHVRVVGHRKNVGKGFAVKTGFSGAAGDAVVFLDSDLDVDFGQVRQYVDALRFGDLVIGSKWHRDSEIDVPFVRRFLSRVFNSLVKLLTGIRVGDTQTGIKAVRREAFEKVFRRMSVKRYAFDVEMLAIAKLFDMKVLELPVKLKIDNRFRFSEVWRMILDLLGITYRLRVRKWYQHGA